MDGELPLKAQALEEAFFFAQDERLAESHREMKTLERTSGLLSEVSGIADERVLIRLAQLGVSPASAASLSILPLVAVAWADGDVDAVEREVLVESLDKAFFFQTIDRDIVEAWLALRPPATLVDAWEAYVRHLGQHLGAHERKSLADEVLERARRVARAAGGFLGLGRLTDAEEALLARLGRALHG